MKNVFSVMFMEFFEKVVFWGGFCLIVWLFQFWLLVLVGFFSHLKPASGVGSCMKLNASLCYEDAHE